MRSGVARRQDLAEASSVLSKNVSKDGTRIHSVLRRSGGRRSVCLDQRRVQIDHCVLDGAVATPRARQLGTGPLAARGPGPSCATVRARRSSANVAVSITSSTHHAVAVEATDQCSGSWELFKKWW